MLDLQLAPLVIRNRIYRPMLAFVQSRGKLWTIALLQGSRKLLASWHKALWDRGEGQSDECILWTGVRPFVALQ